MAFLTDFWLIFAKMGNSARKIDSVSKQILTTNSDVKMGNKFKETCFKG